MDIEQIKVLLEKYQNCETSLDEEKQLRVFFSRDNIAEDLKVQQKYFQYLEAERKIELNNPDFEKDFLNAINKKESFFNAYRTPLSIAASIVILLTLYLLIPRDYLKKDSYYMTIEDTYQDPYLAYQEAKKALAFVAEKMETGTKPLSNISKVNKGIEELNNLKKVEQVSKYGKMASMNKMGHLVFNF